MDMNSVIYKIDWGKVLLLLLFLTLCTLVATASPPSRPDEPAGTTQTLRGVVVDKQTGEPLIGATVQVAGTPHATVTNADGEFLLTFPAREYTLYIRYIGYKELQVGSSASSDKEPLQLQLESESTTLEGVAVTATLRRSNEAALLLEQQRSLVVQSAVSAQQISRTQDRDASEVIKRVPGISIIDEKFVMVRGLSQRYNNVWINGSAVPSSEADSRAFSFDIIPGSQLDNLIVVKSPAPEYPADFTGGFILVNTKEVPVGGNALQLSVAGVLNDQTHLRNFLSSRGERAGFPSFGVGGDARVIDIVSNGFNTDWRLKSLHPAADWKANAAYNHRWETRRAGAVSLLAAINYTQSYKTLLHMDNSLYGPYDTANDKSVALRSAVDDQYNRDTRLGAMLNLSFQPSGGSPHRYELKNIFNRITKERYSERNGFNAQPDRIHNMEYYSSIRNVYNGQFTGKHTFDGQRLDWSIGYAYADRDLPDRRLIERTDRTDNELSIYRISREFTRLVEHIASANVNYRLDFPLGTLKAGAYAEYRTRRYQTRQFQYGWHPNNTLPPRFEFDPDVVNNVLIDANYGPDKLFMQEEVDYRNNYEGRNTQASGYVGVNLPVGTFNFYAGVRYEYARQELRMNTRSYEESLQSTYYTYRDFFPSLNATYQLGERHQLRLAYGKSVNRPEFRELSTSVYYDFDLGSNVMGNASLQAAYIHNVDVRYEWYPSAGEQLSVALFYKHFNHPIEWTYTMSGGTDPVYSYVNAEGANNYGIELDVRKRLDFMGLPRLSLSLNAALIHSRVQFPAGSRNINRPMQGQSPYLINAGLFYTHPEQGWNAALLYNRIGKRIIGVGNRYGSSSDGDARNIPNSYEMPRNGVDLSLGKQLGKWELKATVRDLLAERYHFKQFEEVTIDGQRRTIEETTRSYRPGRSYQLSAGYTF
ncbi:MAG: TonB-dependent receptor [Prevotellaceae bacterium]|jgi:outer membrane receptor protein involved in Fe transport|nr:TonB-dependent receptor [Prevotellaceae bacterium]